MSTMPMALFQDAVATVPRLCRILAAQRTTGRFVVRALEDADRDLVLNVVVEPAPGAEATADRREVAAGSIRRELCRLNSEFAHYVPADRQSPDVELRPADDPEFFPAGVKHRYTRP